MRKRLATTLYAIAFAATLAVLPTNTAAAVTNSPSTVRFPGITCANSGPAAAWPSTNQTKRRDCWWGYEIFYSKDHSKLIAKGAGGAVGGLAAAYLPSRVAILVLFGTASGVSDETINQRIDGGTCLKITVIYPGAFYPSSYNCY